MKKCAKQVGAAKPPVKNVSSGDLTLLLRSLPVRVKRILPLGTILEVKVI
jgi:hypothetical protein